MEFTTLTRRVAELYADRPGRDRGRSAPSCTGGEADRAGTGRRRDRRPVSGDLVAAARPCRRPRPDPATGRQGVEPQAARRLRWPPAARDARPQAAVRPRRLRDRSARLDALKAWIARRSRHRPCRHRHRDDLPRSDAGRARRLLAGARRRPRPATCRSATQSGGGADLFGGGLAPDQIPIARRARRAEAAARGPARPQDRPEPQIRLLVLKRARHRRRAHRRHHADLLRARRRHAAARHGRARRAPSRPHADRVQRGRRHAASARSPSTRSRSTGPTAYAAEDADVTLRLWRVLKPRLAAEQHDHRLRDAGAAAGAGARAHGAARHHRSTGRSCRACRAISRRRWRALEAEIHELAGETFNIGSPEAARRHPVRQDGPARRHEDQDRRNGRPGARCSRTSPSRATNCRARSSTGASSPS